MEPKRRKFQGVLNILSFNRHFYFGGFVVLMFLLSIGYYFQWNEVLLYILVAAFVYGLFIPLIVSAYVYDCSDFYAFDWLNKIINDTKEKQKIVNINAGFDETSFILHRKFPGALLSVFDFYNPSQHTEAAIKRARKVSLTYPNTATISTHAIPLKDSDIDIIFLLSAAHEIRSFEEKVIFLKECRRSLKPGGNLIMVEHLRDIPNFLAFTVGFTHFFSKKTWQNAFSKAGFSEIKETKFTLFMSVFQCKKDA